jgi:flavin-dependent dehydrogenase
MPTQETEVAIIGGGPAGTAAALTLLRYTPHRVVLVERGSYRQPRVGETVSPAITSLLEYLGAADCLCESEAIESFSNAAAWGSDRVTVRDHMFTGRGNGWHLDRRKFDLALGDTAQRAGAITLRDSWPYDATQVDANRWQLSIEGNATTDVLATQVIDASGRQASFARRAGATSNRIDQLVGIVAYFTGLAPQTTSHSTLVEAERCGWWYAALVPNGNAVVAFMTDPAQIREFSVNEWPGFYRRLQRTRHISSFLSKADPIPELHIHSAASQFLLPVIGEGWIAAGDAAAAFDPLSSLGIGHALSSGIQAARVVDTRLHGDEELAATYPADVSGFADEFRMRRLHVYGAEARWPDSEFWQLRHRPDGSALAHVGGRHALGRL